MPAALAIAVVIIQAFLVLIHLALAASVGAAFGVTGAAGIWLTALFVALSFTFVSATLIARRHTNRLIDWYYAAASYWFGLAHFLLGGAIVFYFTATALYATNHYVAPAILGALCFVPFFLIHLYGTWQSGRVKLTRVSVTLPGLPQAWRGKTIAFASDLHLGCIRQETFAAQVARKIAAIRSEALFIGGDLYDGSACDERKIIEPLRTIVAEIPRGAYFVTGNHEYFLAEPARALAAVRAAGIRILDNETVDLGGLRVLGVDYLKARPREEFRKILGAAKAEAPTILLKHEPNDLDVARDAGIAFGLFGHTHHGQIWPLSYLTRQVYKRFDYGFKTLGALLVYTSSGAGTWGPPLRLGTKAEIVAVTLS